MEYYDLIADAQRVSDSFMTRITEIASATGGQATPGQLTPLDCEKLRAKWAYGDGQGGGVAWHRLTDIVKANLIYRDIGSMYRGLEAAVKDFKGSLHEFSDC